MKINGINLINFNSKNLFFKKAENKTNLSEKKVDFFENKNSNRGIAFFSNPYYKLLNYNQINFGAMNKIDENIEKAIKENYEANKSVKDFCKKMEISEAGYYKTLHRLKERGEIVFPKRPAKPFSVEELEKAVLANYKAGKSAKEFCEKYGYFITYYYNILRKQGISLRPHIKQDFLEKVKANHETGLSQKQFCEKEGCSKSQYEYAKKKLDLGIPQIKQQHEEELAKKVLANHIAGKSITAFCQREKCSFDHYKRILKEKFNIEYSEEEKRNFLIQKAKEHYLSGKSYKEFCKQYNVSMRTYYTYLKSAGLVLTEYKTIEELKEENENPELAKSKQETESSSGQCLKIRQQKHKDLDKLIKLAKLHHEQGGTAQEFCEKYFCKPHFYRFLLKKNDIKPPRHSIYDEEFLKNVKESFEAGKTAKEFCEETGHRLGHYYTALKKLGIDIKTRRETK